jgi:hypothetical protein
MQVEIVKENPIENKVYFEVKPLEKEYIDLLVFGKEIEIDTQNIEALENARNEVKAEASIEFIKFLNSGL